MRKMIGVANSNYAVASMPRMFCRPLDGALQWLGPSPLGMDEVFNRLKKGEGSERAATETDKAEEWLWGLWMVNACLQPRLGSRKGGGDRVPDREEGQETFGD